MRYLRLFTVGLLLSFAITGCHRRPASATPPPQAQAPIVTTLPPVPPLAFPNVELPQPKSSTPVKQPAPAPKPKAQPAEPVRHRRTKHKVTPAKESTVVDNDSHADSPESAHPGSNGSAVAGAAALGKLSADDAAADPHQNIQVEQLILRTEARLKKVSRSQRNRHKDAVAQIASFLSQAKQAWAMNDVIGAQTLVNKAKILLDELVTNTLPVTQP